jgi:hypothetical protein
MEPENTSQVLNVINAIGGLEVIYGILATIIGAYLGKKNLHFKKVFKELDELTDIIDIATRPDSDQGEKISFNESKRIALEGKDVVLAFKEILAKR